ncbi:hypothetical protein [Paucilactobacillus wasatchensis]|uniref:AP2/ERF domain-containing protein n=1 Tax=Paucilactobacillus wasatchensis TaxID=1335616 RepID=A0A0D0YU19_9LACO|nr:hypothetical protein [Paucilactobacillus wasatchensis]KIS02764.1 hypothetical protein WDC_1654 [Paucilactobacillus wasatchensis]
MIDLTGRRFGRLTVIKRAKKKVQSGNACWLCQCSCGNIRAVDGYLLRTGATKSCGCYRAELSAKAVRQNEKFSANIGNAENLKFNSGVFKASVVRGKKNRSGVIGVSYDKKEDMWFARLMVDGRYVLLKSFKEFEEAVTARKNAERRYLYRKETDQISV